MSDIAKSLREYVRNSVMEPTLNQLLINAADELDHLYGRLPAITYAESLRDDNQRLKGLVSVMSALAIGGEPPVVILPREQADSFDVSMWYDPVEVHNALTAAGVAFKVTP